MSRAEPLSSFPSVANAVLDALPHPVIMVAADGKTITGTWSQGDNSFPLELRPGTIAPRRIEHFASFGIAAG